MRIAQIKIQNFRGISHGELQFPEHCVLVGDNNSGKSTVLEAIDLVLGPERLSRRPVVDEHDFYAGKYIDAAENPVPIGIEAVVIDLTEEQVRHFKDHLEWWNSETAALLQGPPPEETNVDGVTPALRVRFTGTYDKEEDDFVGATHFLSPTLESGEHEPFRTSDKRKCGFLLLRTLRTGSRALSLERGSLLDIILRLQETQLKMWEEVLDELRVLPVAEDPELGISTILSDVQQAIRSLVPSEWANNPHMRVSDLTRETLRRTLTVFMDTGSKREDGTDHAAPFQHQGTGTINTLVLALLSIIADLKQNVIFAMEEPEIAIPPHTQKRIVNSVRSKSAQAIFTSHSPYVLEEFEPSQVLVLKRDGGVLSGVTASYPPTVKPKAYRAEVRARFCEALLAKRVLLVEGRTEFDSFPAAARRLNELHPDDFKTFEAMGIAVVDARTDSQVAPLGDFFRHLGKTVFAVFDQQEAAQGTLIAAAVDHPFESPEKNFERLVINGTEEVALRRYALALVADGEWPQHLVAKTPTATMPVEGLRDALRDFFSHAKGAGSAADLLGSCTLDEMPKYIYETLHAIREIVQPTPAPILEAPSEPEAATAI